MRILHLISSGGMYGAEAVILNLSRVLNASGQDSSLLGVFANAGAENLQLHEAAGRAGVESHRIACSGQLDRSVPATIRALVGSTRADLVHAHGYKADVYAFCALRKSRTPLVSTCHTWYDNDLAVRLYGAVDRWVLRHFQGVVAVSDEVRNRLLQAGVRAERIRLIRNGVNLEPFLVADAQRQQRRTEGAPLCIGLVGRLAPEKGVDLYLRAAATLVESGVRAKFLVAGDGPDGDFLQKLLTELDLGNHARFIGQVGDMPGFYSSLDLLVSASRQEGLPVALLEGMASGLPVVATAVGAVPQVVRDRETGVLVQPNDPAALAEGIRRLVDDPSLRERLARSGQKLIEEQFSAERMATEYLDVYHAALAQDAV